MREPERPACFAAAVDYVIWARENKKRADRLLAAAKAVVRDNDWDWSIPSQVHVNELRAAAIDYEDQIG